MEEELLHKLALRSIKPTALRLLILRTMTEMKRMVSVTDLEGALDTVDKSTIFRTLTLFLSHQLIHSVDDGSGVLKYGVCEDRCKCTVDEQHMHFCCNRCHKTFCFRGISVPMVQLPDGFVPTGVNYVVKGICADCATLQL